MTRTLDAQAVISELLARRRANEPAAVAFDGDGTLWAGDVGEDVFLYASERELLREPSRAALEALAAEHGIAAAPSPSRTARAMFDAYLAREFPEPTVCEMMTWCYAGFSLQELGALVTEALAHAGFRARLRQELAPVLAAVRASAIRAVVVSASPRPIVEAAAHAWGFGPHEIAASTPQIAGGMVLPAMDGRLPYAAHKCPAARALFGDARWLAAFGDNGFDVDMLAAAELAVAVHPKPALLARLAELSNAVILDGHT